MHIFLSAGCTVQNKYVHVLRTDSTHSMNGSIIKLARGKHVLKVSNNDKVLGQRSKTNENIYMCYLNRRPTHILGAPNSGYNMRTSPANGFVATVRPAFLLTVHRTRSKLWQHYWDNKSFHEQGITAWELGWRNLLFLDYLCEKETKHARSNC